MIERLRRYLPRSELVYHVSILTTGTLLGRGIAVIAMPLLTRLYTPEDFSALASYSAALGILSVIACLRFEIAIPLAENEATAASLLMAALLGPIVLAAAVALLALLIGDQMAHLFPQFANSTILWLLPPGVLLVGMYQAMQFWATRKKQFSYIASTRVMQALAGVSSMLALGFGGIGAAGLTFGHMVMQGAGAVHLAVRTLRAEPSLLRGVTGQDIIAAVHEYRRFPLWSMPEALANVAGLQIPILLIASFADSGEAGQFIIAMQVMVMPMMLVGSSLGQVYLSRAPAEHRNGVLVAFTLSMIKRLALLGTIPITLLGLTAPWTFPMVFGESWARGGVIAAMMVPWIVLQFICAPVSMVLHVVGRSVTAMMLQISGMGLRLGGTLLAVLLGAEMVEVLVTASALFYLIMFIIVVQTARIGN